MRIALVGLGSIAQRAYLPIVAALSGVELILCSRDAACVSQLAQRYRVREVATSPDELGSMRVDAAFVHAATEAHESIVSTLLNRGIHVYVDKPLAYTLDAAQRMVALASERQRVLMVGFNRRYAPMYRQLAEQPDRRNVILQKNRHAQPERARTFVFDDFIHVVDTLRFLAPGPIEDVRISGGSSAGLLHYVQLHLRGAGFDLVGLMNRDSGANEETLEVMSPGHKWRVRGLSSMTHQHEGSERTVEFDDWETVLSRRGFPQIVAQFIECARGTVEHANATEDALATHVLCEQIVTALERMPRAASMEAGSPSDLFRRV
jgi:virulence factor